VTQILVPATQKWVVTNQLRTTDLESDKIDDFLIESLVVQVEIFSCQEP
jgi:hypothetical protein